VDQLAALVPADRFDPMARPLRRDEARRVAGHPLIDVGAHTVHHLALSTASPDDLFRDVFEGRSALERAVGKPVTHFAYPYGDTSEIIVQRLAKAEYRSGVTVNPGPNAFFASSFALRRTMIFGDQDLEAFKAKLQVFKEMDLR